MSEFAPTGTPVSDPGHALARGPETKASAPRGTGRATASDPESVRVWIRLVRPPLSLLGLAPTAATLALLWANGAHLLAVPAFFSIVAVALVLSGANLLDEYLEFERAERASAVAGVLGPGEAGALLAAAGIAPLRALRAGIGLLIAGTLAGIPLVMSGGGGVALLGIGGLGVAFLYSSTSFALKRLPGGEGIVFLALGPGIAAAVALAQRSRVSGQVLLTGCALGLLALALVEAVHLMSKERDERLGLRTLVSYLGMRGSRLLYILCVIGAFVLLALVALPKGAPHGALAVLLALPAALVALTGMLRARNTTALALIPRQTLRLYAFVALWLVVGLLASGVVARLVALLLGSGA
jgi:1,4-dihydroxy-2-naphthoate polyprenyltransferase